jgi:hypothetical protein
MTLADGGTNVLHSTVATADVPVLLRPQRFLDHDGVQGIQFSSGCLENTHAGQAAVTRRSHQHLTGAVRRAGGWEAG